MCVWIYPGAFGLSIVLVSVRENTQKWTQSRTQREKQREKNTRKLRSSSLWRECGPAKKLESELLGLLDKIAWGCKLRNCSFLFLVPSAFIDTGNCTVFVHKQNYIRENARLDQFLLPTRTSPGPQNLTSHLDQKENTWTVSAWTVGSAD